MTRFIGEIDDVLELRGCLEDVEDVAGRRRLDSFFWNEVVSATVASAGVFFEDVNDDRMGGNVTHRQFATAISAYIRLLEDPTVDCIHEAFPNDLPPDIAHYCHFDALERLVSWEHRRANRLNSREVQLLEAMLAELPDEDIVREHKVTFDRLQAYKSEIVEKSRSADLDDLKALYRRVKARESDSAR